MVCALSPEAHLLLKRDFHEYAEKDNAAREKATHLFFAESSLETRINRHAYRHEARKCPFALVSC